MPVALMDATRELAAVREALSGLETQAVVGAVQALTDVAESLARTTEIMRAMQPAEWMTHEQAAAYLQRHARSVQGVGEDGRGAEALSIGARHSLQPDGARRLAYEPVGPRLTQTLIRNSRGECIPIQRD